MKPYRLLLVLGISTLAVPPCLAQTQDSKGCTDSPLLSRFPGSIITGCRSVDDESFKFDMESGKPQKVIEGKFEEIRYHFPSTASKAQVVRNLTSALHQAGYTFDYDSGGFGDYTVHMGKTWISVQISASGDYREVSVTETALTQDVVANAAALDSGLNGAGHVVVNGILFDTAKADVKPESDAALVEVSKMLKGNPALKVYVVGHTDNVGALAGNMDLSKRRAAAVTLLLSTKYGVAASQLSPYGDGPYAPIASNDTEDGRALNRRVELVKQ
jgi:outer membrane protein OmpA-like peptidoglycan-associated protein